MVAIGFLLVLLALLAAQVIETDRSLLVVSFIFLFGISSVVLGLFLWLWEFMP